MIARGYAPKATDRSASRCARRAPAIGDSQVRVTGIVAVRGRVRRRSGDRRRLRGRRGRAPCRDRSAGSVAPDRRLAAGSLVGRRRARPSHRLFVRRRAHVVADAGRVLALHAAATPRTAATSPRASDPWVTIGPTASHTRSPSRSTGTRSRRGSSSAVLASRSTDGGRTWSDPATLIRDGGSAVQRQGIDHRRSRVTPGFAYAAWDRLDQNGNGPTWFARTTNGGSRGKPARPIYDPGGTQPDAQQPDRRRVRRGTHALFDFFTEFTSQQPRHRTRCVIRSIDKGADVERGRSRSSERCARSARTTRRTRRASLRDGAQHRVVRRRTQRRAGRRVAGLAVQRRRARRHRVLALARRRRLRGARRCRSTASRRCRRCCRPLRCGTTARSACSTTTCATTRPIPRRCRRTHGSRNRATESPGAKATSRGRSTSRAHRSSRRGATWAGSSATTRRWGPPARRSCRSTSTRLEPRQPDRRVRVDRVGDSGRGRQARRRAARHRDAADAGRVRRRDAAQRRALAGPADDAGNAGAAIIVAHAAQRRALAGPAADAGSCAAIVVATRPSGRGRDALLGPERRELAAVVAPIASLWPRKRAPMRPEPSFCASKAIAPVSPVAHS